MSRVQEISERQEQFNEVVAALEAEAAGIEAYVDILAYTTCTGQPLKNEWEETSRPARGTRKQIAVLKPLLEKTETAHFRELLEGVLKNLTSKPAAWVKQLEAQADFEDSFQALKSTLEDVNSYIAIARARYGKTSIPPETARNLVKELHPVIDTLLDNLIVLSCPHDNAGTAISYATAKQEEWLRGAWLLFKRAGFSTQKGSVSRKGSDYFYLLNHIDNAGVLEEQNFYTSSKFSDADTSFMTAEELEAEKREHMSKLEPSGRFGTPGFPIDENTVAIDESIVETD